MNSQKSLLVETITYIPSVNLLLVHFNQIDMAQELKIVCKTLRLRTHDHVIEDTDMTNTLHQLC